MTQDEANSVVLRAKALLEVLKSGSDDDVAKAADDLLLLCYRLLDRYVIVRSTSPRFSGRTFDPLRDVIYQIESRPDEALRSSEWRRVLEAVLEDIVAARVVIGKK